MGNGNSCPWKIPIPISQKSQDTNSVANDRKCARHTINHNCDNQFIAEKGEKKILQLLCLDSPVSQISD